MKHAAYTGYLLQHKGRVLVHAIILGVPLRGLMHDLSKLHPLEWKGIGRQFYPSTPEERERNAILFEEAQAHHKRLNLHEVDHWYLGGGTCDAIPESILKEVMADWAAFGGLCLSKKGIRHQAWQCYEKWGRHHKMHENTRAWIQGFLDLTDAQKEICESPAGDVLKAAPEE
jgi:hypothetical protein